MCWLGIYITLFSSIAYWEILAWFSLVNIATRLNADWMSNRQCYRWYWSCTEMKGGVVHSHVVSCPLNSTNAQGHKEPYCHDFRDSQFTQLNSYIILLNIHKRRLQRDWLSPNYSWKSNQLNEARGISWRSPDSLFLVRGRGLGTRLFQMAGSM